MGIEAGIGKRGTVSGGSEPPVYSNIDPDFGELGPARLPRAALPDEVPTYHSVGPDGAARAQQGPYALDTKAFAGAILDLDGFLLNSERPIVRCIMLGAQDLMREATGESEARLPMSIVRRINKEALRRADNEMSCVVRGILADAGALPERCHGMTDSGFPKFFEEIRAQHFDALLANGEFKALVGAIEFVKELSSKLGGKVSIYTGSPKKNADLEIRGLGLDQYLPEKFRVYSSGLLELGLKGKPEPDGFRVALGKLGLSPGARWLSGGDRKNDFIGAMAAVGCEVFLAVPEDLDEAPFLKALKDAEDGAIAVGQSGIDELRRSAPQLHQRLIILPSLEGKSVILL